MTAELQVHGSSPSQTLWIFYQHGAARDFDWLSVQEHAEAKNKSVRFNRTRNGKTSTLFGIMEPNGEVYWALAWDTRGKSVGGRKEIDRLVARSANAIDYLLEKYFARMAAGNYHEADPPRLNPMQHIWMQHLDRHPSTVREVKERRGKRLDSLAWVIPVDSGKTQGMMLYWNHYPTLYRYAVYAPWEFVRQGNKYLPFRAMHGGRDNIRLPSPTDLQDVTPEQMRELGMAGYVQMVEMAKRWKQIEDGKRAVGT